MIKAVIFVFFGVIVTEGLRPFLDTYFIDKPDDRPKASQLVRDYTKHVISYDDFLIDLSELAGVKKEVVSEYLSRSRSNKPLFDFIEELRPRYKIAILSNAGRDAIRELLSETEIALFDEKIVRA